LTKLTELGLYSNPISNCQLLREELRNDCPTPPVPVNKPPERLLAPADR